MQKQEKGKRGRPPWKKLVQSGSRVQQESDDEENYKSRSRSKDIQSNQRQRGRQAKIPQKTQKRRDNIINDEDDEEQEEEAEENSQTEKSNKTLSEDDKDFEEPEEEKEVSSDEYDESVTNNEDSQMTSESKATPVAPMRGRGRGRGKKVQIQEPSTNVTSNTVNRESRKRKSDENCNALQIDIDIEEESQKKQIIEREQIDIARTRHPVLFKIFDERNSLKFKSAQWIKQQAIKKSVNKSTHHIFKNLKQILTNYDPDSDGKQFEGQFNYQRGSYMSIDCGISVKQQMKYCDFTGFHSKYRHKANGLRYTEENHYASIEKMQNNKVEDYLSLRKVIPFIK